MSILKTLQNLFSPKWEDDFLKRIKWFMVGYGWSFTAVILITLVLNTSIHTQSALYSMLFTAILLTTLVQFMPLDWLKRLMPISVPSYMIFLHYFLLYTGGSDSPYLFMYFMPMLFASMLFGFAGAAAAYLLILTSHLFIEIPYISEIPQYLASMHFIETDLVFFLILLLVGMMGASIAMIMKKDKQTLQNLFMQVEKAKIEWERSFDAINDMIFIIDKEHQIKRANTAVARQLNKPMEGIINKKCYELIHCTDTPIPTCPHEETLKTKQTTTSIVDEPRLGIFEVTTYPVFFDDNKDLSGSVHYMKDITAKKKAEEALKKELKITRALHNVDRAILSAMDKKSVFMSCITNLKALVDSEYVSIAAFDSDDERFKMEASLFLDQFDEHKETMLFDSQILRTALFSKASRYCSHITREEFHSERIVFKRELKSILIVPMISKGLPLGTLNLGSAKENRFTKEEIELIERYALQIAIAVDNSNLFEGIQNMFMDTVHSLSSAIDAKSPWTENHSKEVSNYAVAIARELCLDENFIEDLKMAVLLHDIGKIGINETILNKASKLSNEEMDNIKEHPVKGVKILTPIKGLKNIIPIIRHHHEWWDGSGYPDRLSGNMIPLGARILSAADAYEAMIADRPYRKRLAADAAVQEIMRCSGTQFDPQIVDVFIAVLKRHGM